MHKNRLFGGNYDIRRFVHMETRHVMLKAGGAAALQADYLAPTFRHERVAILGATACGTLAAAGAAVLEARKAPMELPSGKESYDEPGAGKDNQLWTPGSSWDVVGYALAGAAGVIHGVQMLPPACCIVTRPQHADADVPLVRLRDNGSTFASGTFTFAGLPANNDTITVFGTVLTFKTTLTGAADEIKIASSAAEQCEWVRNAINQGVGAGENFSTSITVPRDETKGYAVDDAHASVVTVRAYVGGTAGNALTIAESATNVTVSGATLASGADGLLGSATNDYIEVALTYAILQPK